MGIHRNPRRTPRETFDAYVHPEFGAPAHAVLLDLVVARIAERAREAGLPSLVASGGAFASEEHYVGLLRAAGFTVVKRFARMRRGLDGPVASPRG